MKNYLSHGMGINSTALMLLLEDEGIEFESVFVNHGGDYPETYEYANYLRDKGFKITEIIPDYRGCHTILEYCYKNQFIPSETRRWCTANFKIQPIYNYVEIPCKMMLGISYEERKKRIHKSKNKNITNSYPLVERKITRVKCTEIIKNHNLKIPRQSGCFFCPCMNKKKARELYLHHFELYKKVLDLERNCKQSNFYLKQGIPFDKFAKADVPPLTKYFKAKK